MVMNRRSTATTSVRHPGEGAQTRRILSAIREQTSVDELLITEDRCFGCC
jgi:hypothetical protein